LEDPLNTTVWQTLMYIFGLLSIILLFICPELMKAQMVVATIPLGNPPNAVAVNPVTNKIYVAAGDSWTQEGTVTVIEGATNSTTTLTAGIRPHAVAINPVTNKIYVANAGCAGPFGCGNSGSITVIDGATNSMTTLHDPNANGPDDIAVNSVTNKVYVANLWTGNITVIDGATDSIITIKDPNANQMQSVAVAVNSVTDKIYVVNNNRFGFSNTTIGNITVVDGASNTTSTVIDPNAMKPAAVAVNPVTNTIYIANLGGYPGPNHGNVTVIDGASNNATTLTDPNALAPASLAVNTVTNRIYVANLNDSALSGSGGITIIDGAANSLTNVRDTRASSPTAVVVDSTANKVYVANYGINPTQASNVPGNVTVIDGGTNSLTNLADPNAINPNALAVNSATSRIYVSNVFSENTTVIDGGSGVADFSLSASALSPSTVNAGQSASGSVTVNASGGFNNSVSFSCSVQPSPSYAPACALTPSHSGASVAVMTTAPTIAQKSSGPSGWFDALWIPLIGFVCSSLGGVRKNRRRTHALIVWAILFGGIAFELACGGGDRHPSGGTPSGNYTITVKGTSGPLQHSTSFALAVQ